jgi:intracellular multiplication protein IcmC
MCSMELRNLLYKLFLISLLSFLLSGCGSNPPDLGQIFENLSATYPSIWKLLTAASYVLGFLFALKAVYVLKIYGQNMSMMSQTGSIKGPIFYFLVAGALIYLPTMFGTILNTTFGYSTPKPLEYAAGGSVWTDQGLKAVLGIVQIVGLIAFIRGLIYIARAGDQGGQPGQMSRGLTHIIGGILAINIVGVKEVLWNTLGFS